MKFMFNDYSTLFWSEKFWAKNFGRTPPGLMGSGTGISLGEFYLGGTFGSPNRIVSSDPPASPIRARLVRTSKLYPTIGDSVDGSSRRSSVIRASATVQFSVRGVEMTSPRSQIPFGTSSHMLRRWLPPVRGAPPSSCSPTRIAPHATHDSRWLSCVCAAQPVAAFLFLGTSVMSRCCPTRRLPLPSSRSTPTR